MSSLKQQPEVVKRGTPIWVWWVGGFFALVMIIGMIESATQTATPVAPASQPAPAAAAPAPRPALRPAPEAMLTVDVLDTYQALGRGGERYTDAQRRHNWQRYFAGRRVRWQGTVVDVFAQGQSCGVNLHCGSTALGADTTCSLPLAQGTALSKGQTVFVEGTLISHGMTGYLLGDVQIVG